MTEVICTDTGAGRARGKSESQEKRSFWSREAHLGAELSLAMLGLKGLLLVFRVSCGIFKMCFLE